MINLGNGKYRDIEDIDEAFNKAKKYDDMQKPFTYRVHVPRLEKELKELKDIKIQYFKQICYLEQRLYNLKDRYLHQNQKHFYELCDLYFDEDET